MEQNDIILHNCAAFMNVTLNLVEGDRMEMVMRRRRAFRARIIHLAAQYRNNINMIWANFHLALLPLLARPTRERGRNRVRSSDWWNHVVQLHFDEEEWIANFRMRRDSFERLCVMLEPSLSPSPFSLQLPLETRKKVAITLYKLASCCEYRLVANQFGVAKSTVQKTVYAVVKAINTVLLPLNLSMPNDVEAREISYLVEQNTKFPQTCLSIDGSHIPILPPTEGYRDFINRKGWPSVVLQGVVDHRYRFRDISCILPGSAHDARVLAESSIYHHADVMVPKSSRIIDGVDVPMMIVGDAAYPLLPWLMKGYTGHLTPEQESFNVYLSSFRINVEVAFGRLKARWRCLLKRIDTDYRFVPQIVAACCALHNYVENGKEPFIEQWLELVNEAELMFPQPPPDRARERDNYDMANVRNHLCQHLAATLPLRRSSFRLNNVH